MFTYPVTQMVSGASPFPVPVQLQGHWDPSVGVTGTAPVTVWSDQSGNLNDWLQDTGGGGGGPTLSSGVLNGLDVITFDGSNDKMNQSRFITAGDGEMMCVVRRTTSSNKGWCCFGSSAAQAHLMYTNLLYESFGGTTRLAGAAAAELAVNTWGIYNVTHDSGVATSWRVNNTGNKVSTFLNTGWNTTFYLGSGNNGGAVGATHSFQGQIAEMAVWDRVLSAKDRTDVFNYFNAKFALGL
jgi:hypothetical protein